MRILMGFDSQEAFGATLGGFSVNRVSRAERGENPIPTEMLTALAEKGVNVNYILTGEGPMWARHIVRLSQRVSPDELREILAELEKHQEQTGAIPGRGRGWPVTISTTSPSRARSSGRRWQPDLLLQKSVFLKAAEASQITISPP